MWLLKSAKDADCVHYLSVGTDYIVGRKDCVILIANDQSISRKHSVLAVSHDPESNVLQPQRLPILTLKDLSKYGTFINGSKVESGSTTVLKHGDKIVFGCLKTNEWNVHYEPMVVCSSCLEREDKKSLKGVLLKLGGHFVTEWTKDCTHLAMSKLDITVKVISALITCCPMVKPEFFRTTLEAVEQKTALPDPKEFLPPLTDAAIKKDNISFSADERRKTIFEDRTFIFLTQKQFKRLNQTVSFGRGQAILMEEGSDDGRDDVLVEPGTCVLHADPQDNTQRLTQNAKEWITHVMELLKRHELRPIQDAEVGLAVLHSSCDIHCNPRVTQAGVNLMQPLPSQSLDTQSILAADTEASQIHTQRNTGGGFVIPSTAENVRARDTQRREHSQARSRIKQERISGDRDVGGNRGQNSNGVGEVSSDVSRISETLQESTRDKPAVRSSPRKGAITSYFGAVTVKREQGQERTEALPVKLISSEVARHDTYEFQSQTDRREKPQAGERNQRQTDSKDHQQTDSRMQPPRASHNQPERSEKSETTAVKEEAARDLSPQSDKRGPRDTDRTEIGGQRKALQTDARKRNSSNITENQRSETFDETVPTVKRKRGDEMEGIEDEERLWSKRRNIKQDISEDDSVSQEPYAEETRPRTPTEIPFGYITTTKPLEEQVMVNRNLEYLVEENLPSKLIVTEERSLVVRRPKPRRAPVGTNADGQPVKNFKKFRKASYPGLNSLPRIIGGSDLEVHSNKQNRDVEDWFQEQLQFESQEDQTNSLADDLFNWEPKTKKSRKR